MPKPMASASLGMPMSATTRSPAYDAPGSVTSPILGKPNVTVASARTAL